MKKVGVIVLSFLLVFSSLITVMASDGENEKKLTSKIATYNMAAGIGTDGTYDLEGIADTIRETGADIIGLQEVDVHWGSRSNNENTIERLAIELDMYYYVAPIYDMDPLVDGDPRRQYGVGILSKYPILNASNREITRLSTQDSEPEPKPAPGFLEAQIDINGEEVWFYVTHLDYRSDPTVREMQVADMLEIMSEHQYNILVGDLNARPDAEELDPLFQWFDDAWSISNDNPGYTFPADSPDRRIDYVLVSPRMQVNSAYVTQSVASDHVPVTAEITFLGENSNSIEEMKKLVERFAVNGEFESEEAVHLINIHLDALNHFENQNRPEKMVKHIESLKILLNYQKNNEWISLKAYSELNRDTNYLLDMWR